MFRPQDPGCNILETGEGQLDSKLVKHYISGADPEIFKGYYYFILFSFGEGGGEGGGHKLLIQETLATGTSHLSRYIYI